MPKNLLLNGCSVNIKTKIVLYGRHFVVENRKKYNSKWNWNYYKINTFKSLGYEMIEIKGYTHIYS